MSAWFRKYFRNQSFDLYEIWNLRSEDGKNILKTSWGWAVPSSGQLANFHQLVQNESWTNLEKKIVKKLWNSREKVKNKMWKSWE